MATGETTLSKTESDVASGEMLPVMTQRYKELSDDKSTEFNVYELEFADGIS
ncbi:MAG: hypothetical protein HBSAPP04_27460 [Ignavibacteriaceae bacterium]|nr:MAG: hypothetical protein HBSAPP04_27460 [Ignavibacteriaceae bacterium]